MTFQSTVPQKVQAHQKVTTLQKKRSKISPDSLPRRCKKVNIVVGQETKSIHLSTFDVFHKHLVTTFLTKVKKLRYLYRSAHTHYTY